MSGQSDFSEFEGRAAAAAPDRPGLTASKAHPDGTHAMRAVTAASGPVLAGAVLANAVGTAAAAAAAAAMGQETSARLSLARRLQPGPPAPASTIAANMTRALPQSM